MIEYIQSEKECFERCTGLVCLRCGNALSPVETVDNSNRPTFWAGCLSCMIFSPGTQKEVYEKAKEISKDYRNISMDDLCCIVRCIYADHLAALAELKQVIKAQARLLASYRFGGTPPEWVFDTLEKWDKQKEGHDGN
jgi:hypothetical protein